MAQSSGEAAPARLFDATGVLAVAEGAPVPASVDGGLFLEDGSAYRAAAPEPATPAPAPGEQVAPAKKAARKRVARGPARENR